MSSADYDRLVNKLELVEADARQARMQLDATRELMAETCHRLVLQRDRAVNLLRAVYDKTGHRLISYTLVADVETFLRDVGAR